MLSWFYASLFLGHPLLGISIFIGFVKLIFPKSPANFFFFYVFVNSCLLVVKVCIFPFNFETSDHGICVGAMKWSFIAAKSENLLSLVRVAPSDCLRWYPLVPITFLPLLANISRCTTRCILLINTYNEHFLLGGKNCSLTAYCIVLVSYKTLYKQRRNKYGFNLCLLIESLTLIYVMWSFWLFGTLDKLP